MLNTAKNMEAGMKAINGWVAAGKIRPKVFKTFPLTEVKAAMMTLWDRTVVGKTILVPP